MRVPEDLRERAAFYQDVLNRCLVSRQDRRAWYDSLRKFYLYASDTATPARYNRIYPQISLKASYLYSQETMRFSVEPDDMTDSKDVERGAAMGRRAQQHWHGSKADEKYQEKLKWSLVFGCMLSKHIWVNGHLNYYLQEPGNFGVLREDITNLDDQEAVVQIYTISKSELDRLLKDHPAREEIIGRVSTRGKQDETAFPTNVGRLILTNSTAPSVAGTMTGVVSGGPFQQFDYVAKVNQDLVQMFELWVWDDDLSDYRTVTLADPDIVIYDRANIYVEGELPFEALVPSPMYDYFWGISECALIVPLQMWREKRMNEVDQLFARQLKPPVSLSGFMGITDEKAAAFMRPGGAISAQSPSAKVEVFEPKLPDDAMFILDRFDTMMDDVSGMSPILQGKGEQGVRAGQHGDLLAQMSGARLKQTGMIVRGDLEKEGRMILMGLQQEDDTALTTESGELFVAGQFSKNFTVRVSPHTSSPIFSGDMKSTAMELYKEGVIDGDTLVEMVDPPMADTIRERLKKNQARAKQEQDAKEQQAIELAARMPPKESAGFLGRFFAMMRPAKK